jgi:hypothetical protein
MNALEKLKEWSIINGSELLKLRIEDGYRWEELAEQEFIEYIFLKAFPKTKIDWGYNNIVCNHLSNYEEPDLILLKKCRSIKDKLTKVCNDISISIDLMYIGTVSDNIPQKSGIGFRISLEYLNLFFPTFYIDSDEIQI